MITITDPIDSHPITIAEWQIEAVFSLAIALLNDYCPMDQVTLGTDEPTVSVQRIGFQRYQLLMDGKPVGPVVCPCDLMV